MSRIGHIGAPTPATSISSVGECHRGARDRPNPRCPYLLGKIGAVPDPEHQHSLLIRGTVKALDSS
eukprot:4192228-Pyramimonas_sp.AAC.1